MLTAQRAVADEGGVSIWLPGIYGSLAAVPGQPGWSFSTFNDYVSVSAGKGVDFVLGRGFRRASPPMSDFQYLYPSYVFATPVFGGQASLSWAPWLAPTQRPPLELLPVLAADPCLEAEPIRYSGSATSFPPATLRWNQGVNNFMIYGTGDIPVGNYNSDRLANLAVGHGAIDAGGGYTYFDPQTGHEFSAVIGATYNFINPTTQYQNGLDAHLDWGASQFLSASLQVGAVGYIYRPAHR